MEGRWGGWKEGGESKYLYIFRIVSKNCTETVLFILPWELKGHEKDVIWSENGMPLKMSSRIQPDSENRLGEDPGGHSQEIIGCK